MIGRRIAEKYGMGDKPHAQEDIDFLTGQRFVADAYVTDDSPSPTRGRGGDL